jgi:hypothetical protein
MRLAKTKTNAAPSADKESAKQKSCQRFMDKRWQLFI